MIKNHTQQIIEALSALPELVRASRGWPKDFKRLPCACVSRASDVARDYRDDAAYLRAYEYYVRIFAQTADQADFAADAVDDMLVSMGYERTFVYDDDNEDVRQVVLRYRIYE